MALMAVNFFVLSIRCRHHFCEILVIRFVEVLLYSLRPNNSFSNSLVFPNSSVVDVLKPSVELHRSRWITFWKSVASFIDFGYG